MGAQGSVGVGVPGPVIAAVDLSEISSSVVRCAHRAAARLRTSLAVFHAVDGLTGADEEGLLLPPLRRLVSEARREARSSLNAFLEGLGLGPPEAVVADVGPGPAHDAILETASRLGACLVVVGGPHPHVLHGSVAESVLRHCSCPVLVVRRPPEVGYRRLLVGVDGSESSRRAWEMAAALAEAGAAVGACHVLEEAGGGLAGACAELEGWVRCWAGGSMAHLLVEQGSPHEALVAAAEREGAELLAVGRRGRRGVAEVLLGSVAERAMAASRCDVLVAGDEEP